MKSPFRFLISCSLLLGLMLSGGCAGQMKRGSGNMFSFVTENCQLDQVSLLAEGMAGSLSEIFPPGHTALFIEAASPESGEDALGAAFEKALRARGFSIAPEPSEDALTVAYVLDQADEETYYTRLSLSNGLLLSRTYRLGGEGRLTEGAASMRAGGDHGE